MKTIHTLLFLTLLCLPSAASAQAAGVKIIEQSPAGLTQENDQVAEKVAELATQKRLLDQQTILGQIKQPVPQKLDLPAPSQKALSPADIAAKARASVVRVGWTFLCDKCNHWHLELGGGYPITADGAIATCAHVLKTPKMKDGSLIVVDSDNNVYPVTSIIAHDTTMDAAIVKIDHSLVPLPLNDQIHPGDAAFCQSDPLKQRGYFSSGIVNRFFWSKNNRGDDDSKLRALRHLRLNVSTDWAPGSSGSPVLDQYANVIGHVAFIMAMGDSSFKKSDTRQPDDEATLSDIKGSIPLITLHTAIPARSVKELATTLSPPEAE